MMEAWRAAATMVLFEATMKDLEFFIFSSQALSS
jgi:hypothetical protein